MNDWRQRMEKSVRYLAEQLKTIRPDTLSVGFVETFRVPVNGSSVPIAHVASVARQESRILITPYDRALVSAVVRALSAAKLNAYELDSSTVCVAVPPASGEQKQELARHVKKLGEEAKVAVRAVRQDARKQIAARGRGSQREVQEATDAAIATIDELVRGQISRLSR